MEGGEEVTGRIGGKGGSPPRGKDGEKTVSGKGFLLVVSRRRRVLAVTRGGAGVVRVGRSSRCELTVDDPRFPGMAGEVILLPVPLFRPHKGRGNTGKDLSVRNLEPGAPLSLGPFRLLLLPPGSSLWNGGGRASIRRVALFAIPLLLLALARVSAGRFPPFLDGEGAPSRREVSRSAVEIPIPAPPSNGGASTRGRGAVPAGGGAGGGAGEGRRESRLSPSPPLPVPGGPSLPRTASADPPVSPGGGMGEKAFGDALGRAENALRNGDVRRAGSLLAPFLPLMSASQIGEASRVLEAAAAPLFRSAYMRRPFDPGGAGKILSDLAGCGLPSLPSAAKASALLGGKK